MPNCFNLTRKGEDKPSLLREVDNELWRNLGFCEPSPTSWYYGWYNTIGLGLACGQSFADLAQILKEQQSVALESEEDDYKMLREVVKYLDKHFEANAWYESK